MLFVTGVLLAIGVSFAQTQSDQASQSSSAANFARSIADTTKARSDTTAAGADSLRRAASQARRDSLRALAEAEGEKPWMGPVKYKTDYTLNRTTSNWNQDMSFEFSARGVSVTTQTTGTLYSDTETKNDRRNGTSTLGINYTASRTLSVGLDLDLSRVNDGFLKKQYNSDRVSARASYTLPESKSISAKLTARAGSVNDVKPTYSGSGTTSGLNLEGKYSFAIPCTLLVNGSSEFTNRNSRDVSSSLRTHDKDIKDALDASLSFVPLSSTTLRFAYNNTNSRLQYPLSGRQETWTSKAQNVEASLGIKTTKQISLMATGRYKDTDVEYALDKSKSSTFLSKSLSTQLSSTSLLGTTLSSNFDIENANNVMGTGRNGDINSRALSGRISRGVTPAITAEMIGSISLAQYFFRDPGSLGDDRDIYKDGVSFSVNLGVPGTSYSGTASVKRDLEKMVYVRSMNSGNNQTAELYTALGSFAYKRGNVTFTQNASSTLNYTLFHFNSNQNSLSRTTSISSILNFPWSGSGSFKLTHVYRIQDSGSYTKESGAKEATYKRAGGSIAEELYLSNLYKFSQNVSITVGQRFQYARNFSFGPTGKKFSPPRKVLDLLEDLHISYAFSEVSSVDLSASRTMSAFGTNYWNVAATLSKEFF